MTKFNVGDVVRCVRFHGISNIKDNVTYEVVKCTPLYVSLNIGNLYDGRSYGEPNTFSVDRFELAEGAATHIVEKRVVYYEEDEGECSSEHVAMGFGDAVMETVFIVFRKDYSGYDEVVGVYSNVDAASSHVQLNCAVFYWSEYIIEDEFR